MKKNITLTSFAFAVLSILFLLNMNYAVAEDVCSDSVEPTVVILSPVDGDTYETVEPSVTIRGVVKDNTCVSNVEWNVDTGTPEFQQVSEGTINFNLPDRPIDVKVKNIPLIEGDNVITVRATDIADTANVGSDSLTITYIPPVLPEIDIIKYKFTYKWDADDLFSLRANVNHSSEVAFLTELFGSDVEISIYLEDPFNVDNYFQIFNYMIYHDTVEVSKKYRYKNRGDGIWNIEFLSKNDETTSFYIYSERWSLTENFPDTSSLDDFNNFVNEFNELPRKNVRLSITIGDRTYSGMAEQDYCTEYLKKWQCHYNR